MESVYLETSLISYVIAAPSRDLVTAGKQQVSRDWWSLERSKYELFVSDLVELEIARGDQQQSWLRQDAIQGITRLAATVEVDSMADAFLRLSSLPRHALADATHIAIATVFGVDYLLTWNCRHIANPHILKKLAEIAESQGYELPVVCTPIELLEGAP